MQLRVVQEKWETFTILILETLRCFIPPLLIGAGGITQSGFSVRL